MLKTILPSLLFSDKQVPVCIFKATYNDDNEVDERPYSATSQGQQLHNAYRDMAGVKPVNPENAKEEA